MADYDQERGLVEAAELARGLRADREYLERDTGEPRSREGERVPYEDRIASDPLEMLHAEIDRRKRAEAENERLREALEELRKDAKAWLRSSNTAFWDLGGRVLNRIGHVLPLDTKAE